MAIRKTTKKEETAPKGYTTNIPLTVQIYTTTKPTKKQIQEITDASQNGCDPKVYKQ